MPDIIKFKTKKEYLEYYRIYREKNREKLREYNRTYNQLWRKTNGYHNEVNSKKRYPKKEFARSVTNLAVRHGILKKGVCEKCGNKIVHAHHDDYQKPLEIRWLCPRHHSEFHSNLKKKLST